MKNRTLHFIGTQAVRLVALSLMLAMTVGAMMNLQGYFDFTFIERVPLHSAQDPSESETEDVQTDAVTEPDAPETEAVTEPVGSDTAEIPPTQNGNTVTQTPVPDNSASGPAAVQTPQRENAKSVSADFQSVKTYQNKGYRTQNTGIYQRGRTVLAKLPLSGLGKNYSYSEYEARTTQTTEFERGCVVTEEVFVTTDRPAVTLCNGYILREVNGKFTLLKPDGTTLLSDYDESSFRLTELRDENGNPLFAAVRRVTEEVYLPILNKDLITGRMVETGFFEEEPVKMEFERYTYYILQDGKWVVSSYNDEFPPAETDFGLQFDSPLDFGESDCEIVRYYDSGSQRWGYKNEKTGQILIYPRYTEAYNFHDGYAIAMDHYFIYILNEQGAAVYQMEYARPEKFQTYYNITLPDTDGIEALGSYYFSHGLTRIRVRKNLVNYKYYDYIKESDETFLFDVNGNQQPLPAGYTLEAYADGVLLLKNKETELYGCMNYKSEWIVQPTYSHVTPSVSGLIVVGNEKGKKGLCDSDGNWILPQVFDYISIPSKGGMIAIYDKTVGWQVMQMMSK